MSKLLVKQAGTAAEPQLLPLPSLSVDAKALWKPARRVGRGAVLTVDTGSLAPPRRAVLAARGLESVGDALGHGIRNAERLDGVFDGVLSVRFDDKLLYFNSTEEDRVLDLEFRAEDFPQGKPQPLSQRLAVPARTIVTVPLVE